MINNNIHIENARIGFKNFSGVAGKFNMPGKRNFCIFLDYGKITYGETPLLEDGKAVGRYLQDEGWNVKWLAPKDEDEEKAAYLQVTVSYENVVPTIILLTGSGKVVTGRTKLTEEDTLQILDWAEIVNVDLTLRPYNWEVQGKSGVKAYVKSMYITIEEDLFAKKYKDVPDSAVSSFVSNPI